MSKSILKSIKPYYGYLILKGLKKLELSKNRPKFPEWDKRVYLYITKDKRSLQRVPEAERNDIAELMGTVPCVFTVGGIMEPSGSLVLMIKHSCLTKEEIIN